MNRKNGKLELIIILIFILSFSVTGDIYRVYVDREFGFWGVRSNDINHTISYTERTLNINTGDTIEWENDDSEGDRVTIISDNLLWEGGKSLGRIGDIFRFTFNSSGTYRFHISEQSRVTLNASDKSNFTTTYNEEEDIYETTGYVGKEISTENFPLRRHTIKVSGPTIGNGTHPITYNRITGQNNHSSAVSYGTMVINKVEIKPAVTVTPGVTVTPKPTPIPTPKLMESYQEFTLYETLKRWFVIIKGD